MVDWRWTGYNALILLAGMQAIPKDLYEAAAIDGAGQWRQFWRITLPMLTPTFVFVVILSTIGGLQLFTEPLVFGNGNMRGGTQREFQTLAMYMFEKGINSLNTAGYGAAIAWALFLMIAVVAVINFAARSGSDGATMNAASAPVAHQPADLHRAGPRRPACRSTRSTTCSSSRPAAWTRSTRCRRRSRPAARSATTSSGCSTTTPPTSSRAWSNSLIVSTVVTVGVVFIGTLAGFAFAKLRFRGRNVLLLAIVVTMMVPDPARPHPAVGDDVRTSAGRTPCCAVTMPFLVSAFGVFMMRQYATQAVSDELIEAARVDGCSTFRIYWNVVLPALRPAAAVLGLLTFMDTWNQFLWPYAVLTPDNPTLQVSLAFLSYAYYTDYSQVFAATAVGTVPLLLVFLVLRPPDHRRHHGRRRQVVTDPGAGFPDDFLWGAATAAYQIEGARHRGRPHTVHLGHLQPHAGPDGRRRHRRRRLRPLPPVPRRREADGRHRPAVVPVLAVLAAGAARRVGRRPTSAASTSTGGSSTSCSTTASSRG